MQLVLEKQSVTCYSNWILTLYHSSKNLFFGTPLNLWVKRTKTQAFFLVVF